MAVRTYALRGQTPVLRVKLTHDHLSAIGGITQKGRIFMQMQERAYKAEPGATLFATPDPMRMYRFNESGAVMG